jgi:hypothetical protein
MYNALIAKNLIIQKQIEEISEKFGRHGIKAVLLKGAALVSAFPVYYKTRNMEDIDMLVLPKDVPASRKILFELGYIPSLEDPHSMKASGPACAVDLTGEIWYLDDKELAAVFSNSLSFPECGFNGSIYYLKPEDFYIHVLAHGAFQHAEINTVWRQDLALIMENWGKTINWNEVEGKLKQYGFQKASNTYLFPETGGGSFYRRLLLSKENPLKGHVARFMFLPLIKKINYIFRAVFPTGEFIQNRYGLGSPARIFFYRLARPFLLLKNLTLFTLRLLGKPNNL